jgi:hypothetical protein
MISLRRSNDLRYNKGFAEYGYRGAPNLDTWNKELPSTTFAPHSIHTVTIRYRSLPGCASLAADCALLGHGAAVVPPGL